MSGLFCRLLELSSLPFELIKEGEEWLSKPYPLVSAWDMPTCGMERKQSSAIPVRDSLLAVRPAAAAATTAASGISKISFTEKLVFALIIVSVSSIIRNGSTSMKKCLPYGLGIHVNRGLIIVRWLFYAKVPIKKMETIVF